MTTDAKKLKGQVHTVLLRISNLDDAEKLKNLHANIQNHPALEDTDREMLNEAVMTRMRAVSPAIATRLGGPKDAKAREFLEGFFEQLSSELDLSGNLLKNGVKTGGQMINGEQYVDVYISYKTESGKNLSLAWLQATPESQAYLRVRLRHVGTNGLGELKSQKFDDETEAKETYRQELRSLLNL
ncbi:hypothetical protein [Ruegeria sp. A3M17]|uniref:hypothetical protein n=1 Tax=Ruegeria sp. A3M17 TaxID=2267229 RepID=UPI000DEB2152|nr:hypothetical protein [Ruegeria sp. A3M17]RBW57780.1 hypothetical protein DS906_10710 [Ruegeria sp. A3M17]